MTLAAKALRRVEVIAVALGEYQVVLTNTENQTICAFKSGALREALTEATEWADFLGVQMTPYRIMGKVVEPVTRDTYKPTNLKTFAQLHEEYRNRSGELNWNKLINWEWQRFRSTFKTKSEMRDWLMPYFVAGPLAVQWLWYNTKGSWMPATGGYLFKDERDATLYRLFFAGNRDDQ